MNTVFGLSYIFKNYYHQQKEFEHGVEDDKKKNLICTLCRFKYNCFCRKKQDNSVNIKFNSKRYKDYINKKCPPSLDVIFYA